jgi:hypothetical protein
MRWIALCCSILASIASASSPPNPEALAERMLEALGGRGNWARTRGTINDSQQNRPAEPTVVRSVITMDFERPRFRIETTGPDGLHLIRVISEGASWRLTRAGVVEPLPPEALADDLSWFRTHVYRTLHRIARRDPAITLALGAPDRLDVLESGQPLLWYRLDARGEPYAFGRPGEPGTLCGPWEFEKEGIRHPIWVSNTDGTWRANIKGLVVNPVLAEEQFAKPAPAARTP